MPNYKKRNESTLVTACLQYLQTHENLGNILHCDRLNSGAVKTEGRRVRLCRRGTPDLFFIMNNGLMVWCECKVGKYNLTDDQLRFKTRIEMTSNHKYMIVRDVDDIINEFDIFKFK